MSNKANKEKAKKIVDSIFSSGFNTNRTFYEMAYNSAMEMAEWKEKQMIEKVAKWLESVNLEYYAQEIFGNIKTDELVEDFKKAMED